MVFVILYYHWILPSSFPKNVGTADFIRDNPAFVENDTTVADVVCNKDTGGLKAFHSWSRGMFFIVSAGGHIEYWQPLYRYRICGDLL